MSSVSGEQPISGDIPLKGTELTPALSQIKGAFASIFPGKKIEDLTTLTKLSRDELDKTLNFKPPAGLGDAATKKLIQQNKEDITKLERLTKMSHDSMRGVLKNAETLDDIIDGIKSSFTKDPRILLTLLKTDASLKEFLLSQVNTAADKRYITNVTGSWLSKKAKALKGAKVKEEIGAKLQEAQIFEVLKKPFSELQAALQPKKPMTAPAAEMEQQSAKQKPLDPVVKPHTAPAALQSQKPESAPSVEMEQHRAQLKPLEMGASQAALGPLTASSQESASPAASTAPSTTKSQAALYAQYGFPVSPAASGSSSVRSDDSRSETPTESQRSQRYERFWFSAAKEPTRAATPAEIAKNIKDYSRAFLTLDDSIRELDHQKYGMTKAEDRAAIDQIIADSRKQLKELPGKVFAGVHDRATLEALDDEYQAKIVALQVRAQAGQSVQDQLDVCDFILSAIAIRRDELGE